ncbi:MAG: hypothetical protein LBR07_09565 [Puniceicoccales bacterium]|nr:hypothetical protein [Puniceicoccales bacterium]
MCASTSSNLGKTASEEHAKTPPNRAFTLMRYPPPMPNPPALPRVSARAPAVACPRIRAVGGKIAPIPYSLFPILYSQLFRVFREQIPSYAITGNPLPQ